MKELPPVPPLHHHKQRRRAAAALITGNKYSKPAAYTVLLLLAYTLGYFSASSSSQRPNIITTSRIPRNALVVPAATEAAAGELDDHHLFSTQCKSPAVDPQNVRQTILDKVFNATSPWEDFPPPHVRGLLRQKRVRGWGSNGAVFENLIRKVKPKTIIEVGTFLGASALHMAAVAGQLGLDTQILCLDDFRGWPGFNTEKFKDIKMVNGEVTLMHQFMQNVVHVDKTESVLFMPFSTASALDKLCEWGVLGDLIEVDAGHDFHSAWSDINKAYKILRQGGVMFGHDYFTSADNKGVRRAVNLFARLKNLRVQTDGQHWVLYPPAKNSN